MKTSGDNGVRIGVTKPWPMWVGDWRLLYSWTIAWGSALLFLVQPIAARMLLPRFGGSAGVWVTCMVFFQVLLLLVTSMPIGWSPPGSSAHTWNFDSPRTSRDSSAVSCRSCGRAATSIVTPPPGSRSLISCSSQPLPSGSLKETNER